MLAGQYKIHLMPKRTNFKKVIRLLLHELKTNKEFSQTIFRIKIFTRPGFSAENLTFRAQDGTRQLFPLIVVYCGDGKEVAQTALSHINRVVKDETGLGIIPRYNRQINPLICYGNGDGDFKTDDYIDDYEPGFVHYRSDFIDRGITLDHNLAVDAISF